MPKSRPPYPPEFRHRITELVRASDRSPRVRTSRHLHPDSGVTIIRTTEATRDADVSGSVNGLAINGSAATAQLNATTTQTTTVTH